MKKLLAILVLCGSLLLPTAFVYSGEEATTPVVTAPAATGDEAAPDTTDEAAATEGEAAPTTGDEAAAATADDEGSIMPSVYSLLHLILLILGTVIATAIALGAKNILARFGVNLSNEQTKLAFRLAEQAVHFASSRAKKAGAAKAGESKLKDAVDYIKGHPAFVNIAKKYADEKLVGMIESVLDKKKSEGSTI